MAVFNVLLDTNVFINAKYDFNRGPLFHLKKYCNDGIVRILTNDIITREVIRHINSDVDSSAQQAINAIEKHGELINAITPPVFESIKDTLLAAKEQLLAAFSFYIKGATPITNEGVSVISLFDDYFNEVKPFEKKKEKKCEFPDAAIIMSIKQYMASAPGASLCVVSNDKGWHDALAGTSGVKLYKDLKTLLTEISKEQTLYRQIISFAATQIPSLKENAESWLMEQDWQFALDEVEMCIECDEIEDTTVKEINLDLGAVEYIDSNDGDAAVTLTGIAKVNVSFSYIDHTEELYDKEDHVWYNTKYGNCVSEIEVPLRLSVPVFWTEGDSDSFDLDIPKFEELDRSSIEIIDYECTEQSDYLDDPYYDICPDCGQKIALYNDGGNGFCIDCALKH